MIFRMNGNKSVIYVSKEQLKPEAPSRGKRKRQSGNIAIFNRQCNKCMITSHHHFSITPSAVNLKCSNQYKAIGSRSRSQQVAEAF